MNYDDNYEELVNQAIDMLDNQRYKEAWDTISKIPEAVKINDYTDACELFSTIALINDQLDKFMVYYKVYFYTIDKADETFVRGVKGLFFTMISMFDSRIYPYAERVIQMILSKFRTSELLYLFSSVYDVIGNYDEALLLLDEALDIDPFNKKLWKEKVLCYHQLNDEEKELECCNYYLALNPTTRDSMILTPIAAKLIEGKQYDEAVEKLQLILNSNETSNEYRASACSMMADVYQQTGDSVNELKYRKLSIRYQPEKSEYVMMLAHYYIATEGKPAKAEQVMLNKIFLHGDNPDYLYVLATIECQLFITTKHKLKLQKALAMADSMLTTEKSARVFELTSRIYLLMKNYSKGLDYAKKAYKLEPNNKLVLLYLVLGYCGCGMTNGFRKFYRIYSKIDDNARQNVIDLLPEAGAEIDHLVEYDKKHKKQ